MKNKLPHSQPKAGRPRADKLTYGWRGILFRKEEFSCAHPRSKLLGIRAERNNGPFYQLNRFLATGFFTGYFPVMPGTIGTLVGAGIYVFISPFSAVYAILLIPFIILSVAVSDYAEKKIFRVKDPSRVVIDEIAGFLLAMAGFPFHSTLEGLFYLVTGFVLFRLLDIWKPYPIRQSQKLEGGFGIVVDDLLAGLFTNLVLQFLKGSGLIRF